MTDHKHSGDKFKPNDRVKRSNGTSGCCGTVKDVRAELTAGRVEPTHKEREKHLMITVAWDNGTISSFSPEALEAAK